MNRFSKWGIIGTIIVALCCFTPILAILGVSAVAIAFLDPILLGLLGAFVVLTLWGLSQKSSG